VFYAKGVSASGGDFDMVFPATIQGYDERDGTAALNDFSPRQVGVKNQMITNS
jgi:hypothetical protein